MAAIGLVVRLALASAGLVAACAGASPSAAPAAAPSAPALPAVVAAAPPVPADPAPCGAHGCLTFGSVDAAIARVLESDPVVLGVGEAHAQKATEQIPSTARRFAEQILPLIAPRSGDLLLELWFAAPRCDAQQVAAVRSAQKPVTERQAEGGASDLIALGNRAEALGVRPHALVPACSEYEAIVQAGPDAIDAMLSMIGRLSAARIAALLDRRRDDGGAPRLVIAYGGALHNDIEPERGREAWSYGPEVAAKTGGRYVELDLIVPELIKDTEAWRKLVWYPHYDKATSAGRVTLFRPRPGSFVLIFPAR